MKIDLRTLVVSVLELVGLGCVVALALITWPPAVLGVAAVTAFALAHRWGS